METRPNWFGITDRTDSHVDGVCTVIDDTATSDREYAITITASDDHVYARETTSGERLPAFCYDRHIMRGGYFCLGLNAGSMVDGPETAGHWWKHLEQFLRLQAVASSTGLWPRAMELDHGQAGYYHQQAIKAAAKLGISEEYELSLLGKPSWITSLLDPKGKRIRNGWLPCPVGCKLKGRRLPRSKCCQKETVTELLRNERARGVALNKFWESVRSDPDIVCCGTMNNCPIRDRQVAEGAPSNA